MFPDNFGLKDGATESGILRMPRIYVLEMVADWQGASIAYSGTDDMTSWLKTNIPKIRLHSKSREELYEI
jgi:hypothetical protein